jgi:hypothetical protein
VIIILDLAGSKPQMGAGVLSCPERTDMRRFDRLDAALAWCGERLTVEAHPDPERAFIRAG